MNGKSPTYTELFALLKSLGFDEGSQGKHPDLPRVFSHVETDTVLAFGRDQRETVTAADLLSTDVHLRGKGIVVQPIEALLHSQAVGG